MHASRPANGRSWHASRVLGCSTLALGVVVGLAAGCSSEEPVSTDYAVCPNAVPIEADACPSQGMACSYSDPVACETGYFLAVCGPDGRWSFDRSGCVPSVGGCGGAGGCSSGGTGGATAGAGGAVGGAGGEASGGAGGAIASGGGGAAAAGAGGTGGQEGG